MQKQYMDLAIQLSLENVANGGGPFGAVIVEENTIIATGVNKVTNSYDPTAHAEIVAIREACAQKNSFQLPTVQLYSSCEPCPMCLGAIYWAHIKTVYFANTRYDAAAIEFDDSFIYHEIAKSYQERTICMIHVAHPNALAAFKRWQEKKDKITY
jgi:guanine deaminase